MLTEKSRKNVKRNSEPQRLVKNLKCLLPDNSLKVGTHQSKTSVQAKSVSCTKKHEPLSKACESVVLPRPVFAVFGKGVKLIQYMKQSRFPINWVLEICIKACSVFQCTNIGCLHGGANKTEGGVIGTL